MNTFQLSAKPIANLATFHKKVAALVPEFDGFLQGDGITTVILKVESTPGLIDAIEAIDPPSADPLTHIKEVIAQAMAFGDALVIQYSAENVLLGINDEDTGIVLTILKPVTEALRAGALKEAINQLRDLPPDLKDNIFITDVRILRYINYIESYLGLPLSAQL